MNPSTHQSASIDDGRGQGAWTPGPWWTDAEYSEEEMGVAVIAARTDAGPLPGNPTRGMVAWASEILPENASVCEANARLIASAPELFRELAHLIGLLEPLEQSGSLDVPGLATLNGARAAIAKAKGQS